MPELNFIMIYIIHKISVLLKINKILKRFLRSIIDFHSFKDIINFFTTHSDEKFKTY